MELGKIQLLASLPSGRIFHFGTVAEARLSPSDDQLKVLTIVTMQGKEVTLEGEDALAAMTVLQQLCHFGMQSKNAPPTLVIANKMPGQKPN